VAGVVGAGCADVPRGTRRGVRRAFMLGAREQLRDEDEQDHLPGGLGVRAGAPARAQGDHQQGGEFAPHRPLAYETMRAHGDD